MNEIKLTKRTPEHRKHYAEGFLAALDAYEKQGMKLDIMRIAGEQMLVMAERAAQEELPQTRNLPLRPGILEEK